LKINILHTVYLNDSTNVDIPSAYALLMEIILIGLQYTPLGFKSSLRSLKTVTIEVRGIGLGTIK